MADIVLNVLLFMPLGGALALAGVRWRRIWLLGALFSAGIEYTQLYIPGRESSLADVVSNSSGALAGCGLALALVRSVRRGQRPSPVQSLAASGLAVAVIAATGLLLQPAFPPSTYFGQWTPYIGHMLWYRGRVLEAALDGVPLPPERLTDSHRVRELLAAGRPLSVRALTGPAVQGLAPLFSIFDGDQREVLLLGPDRDDLVFRYRTRAAAWRLRQPGLHMGGAMRAKLPGDTLGIVVGRSGNGYCLTVNATHRCYLGFTVEDGWALLIDPQWLPARLRTLLGFGWVVCLLLPVGYAGSSRWGLPIGGGMAVVGLAIVSSAVGLVATPGRDWAGGALGFVVGVGCREVVIRRRRSTLPATVPVRDAAGQGLGLGPDYPTSSTS